MANLEHLVDNVKRWLLSLFYNISNVKFKDFDIKG